MSQVKITSYLDAANEKLNTSERTKNVTTVKDRLDYSLGRTFQAALDLIAQRDATNQISRANLIVNGKIVAGDVPGTVLLALESRLSDARRVIEAAPTLQSGPVWDWDDKESMWKTAQPHVAFKTEKTFKPVTLHPGTDKHAPQIEKISVDVPVAKIETSTWSGMWTSKEKHDALARLDALLIAVKKARQRANRTDVEDFKIGAAIAEFILRGPVSEHLTGTDTEFAE
jgi:hypothetical protein